MSLKYRGVVVTPADFAGVDWGEKCRSMGLNTLGIHSGGGESHDIMDILGVYGEAPFRRSLEAQQLDYEYECHAAEALLPRALYDTEPELFCFNYHAGRRISSGNWCISNPRTIELIRQNGRLLAQKLPPSTNRYFFWGADNPKVWCHCPLCANLLPSDQAMLATNVLAEAIRRDNPDGVVPYLAYFELLDPPREIKPADNVILEFAPMYRCYNHPIDDPACAINRGYYEKLLKLLEIFDPASTHVLEYWLDSSNFSNFRKPAVCPPFSAKILEADLRAYTSLGIRSITSFAVYMDGVYFSTYGDWILQEYGEVINRF